MLVQSFHPCLISPQIYITNQFQQLNVLLIISVLHGNIIQAHIELASTTCSRINVTTDSPGFLCNYRYCFDWLLFLAHIVVDKCLVLLHDPVPKLVILPPHFGNKCNICMEALCEILYHKIEMWLIRPTVYGLDFFRSIISYYNSIYPRSPAALVDLIGRGTECNKV